MRKFIIPPVFVALSVLLMVGFYFALPAFQILPFPFNLSGIPISIAGFIIMGKSRDLFKKHQTTLDIKPSTYLIREGIFAK
ncbi:MAG: hypothetical protein ACOC4J_03170, partial [Bacteroidota bacterium]